MKLKSLVHQFFRKDWTETLFEESAMITKSKGMYILLARQNVVVASYHEEEDCFLLYERAIRGDHRIKFPKLIQYLRNFAPNNTLLDTQHFKTCNKMISVIAQKKREVILAMFADLTLDRLQEIYDEKQKEWECLDNKLYELRGREELEYSPSRRRRNTRQNQARREQIRKLEGEHQDLYELLGILSELIQSRKYEAIKQVRNSGVSYDWRYFDPSSLSDTAIGNGYYYTTGYTTSRTEVLNEINRREMEAREREAEELRRRRDIQLEAYRELGRQMISDDSSTAFSDNSMRGMAMWEDDHVVEVDQLPEI